MEFRVLGPLEVAGDDGLVAVGRGKRRTVLAVLLLEANRVVSHDRLIDAVWGGSPPPTARSSLHVLVSELRKLLGDTRGEMLRTHPVGYALQVDARNLDSARFERLLDEGRRALAAEDPTQAAEALREALALWRGP